MTRINLFYLSPNPYGGWVTYTRHLAYALEAQGLKVQLFKVGNNTERKLRPFGYGLTYRNLCLSDALQAARTAPSIITAAAKKFKTEADGLFHEGGAHMVVHDPTEMKNMPDLSSHWERVVTIRRTGKAMLPDSVCILHPYKRFAAAGDPVAKPHRAISTSRIDFDKHTDMILDANRMLRAEGSPSIEIRGFENRLYTKFKIMPSYPEWEQSKAAYPRGEPDAAFHLMRSYELNVDMSVIKGDGGGTQYTTLEAWDAMCLPIVNRDWIIEHDELVPGDNCMAAGTPDELAELVRDLGTVDIQKMVLNGQQCLRQYHSPEVIGSQWAVQLGGC